MILNYSFAGKKILISGGTRGIGRQMVQMFHDDGALVYTVARNPERIAKLRQELPKVTVEMVDLADWKATRKVVESFGPMDYLVNNAGIWTPQDFMDISEEDFNDQFNINLGAVVNVSQVVAKGMMQSGGGGSIVNIGSTYRRHMPGGAVVIASKVAIESFTRNMAVELGPHKIRVNCVHPGYLENVLDGYDLEPEVVKWCEDTVSKLIVKRLIKFKEIGELVAFLLSPLSAMMLGEAVGIEAGHSIV